MRRSLLVSRGRADKGVRRHWTVVLAIGLGTSALSCKRPAWDVTRPADREAAAAELAAFERTWLEPARIPPPTVSLDPQDAGEGGVRVAVVPLRPEDAES